MGGGMVGSGIIGRGPRDRLIGTQVMVIKGPSKGVAGVIKDTNGNLARVELLTGNKVISIEKSKLKRRKYVGYSCFWLRSSPRTIARADGTLEDLDRKPSGGYATTFGQPSYVPENARLEDSCLAGRHDAKRSKPEDTSLAGFLENAESLPRWRREDPRMECFIENAEPLCGRWKDPSVERFFQDAESIRRRRWGRKWMGQWGRRRKWRKLGQQQLGRSDTWKDER
jgi:hypothetical protein